MSGLSYVWLGAANAALKTYAVRSGVFWVRWAVGL